MDAWIEIFSSLASISLVSVFWFLVWTAYFVIGAAGWILLSGIVMRGYHAAGWTELQSAIIALLSVLFVAALFIAMAGWTYSWAPVFALQVYQRVARKFFPPFAIAA